MAELLDHICDVALEQLSPAEKKVRPKKASPATQCPMGAPGPLRQNIPAPLRREVWRRADSKCENCGSQHALQIEHCVPVALGGASTLENLKLFCRSCNQRAAIEVFGAEKMAPDLN